MNKILKHPLFSGSIIMFGGGMAANVINYIYHLLMGRILGPIDYGSLASIYSLIYVVAIVPISTSFAIVKFISQAKDKKERGYIYWVLKKFVFWVAVATSLVLLIISPWVAQYLKIDEFASVVMIAPMTFLLLMILTNQAAMQGLLRFIGVVGPGFSSALGKLLFGLFFVALGFSVNGAVFGILLALIVTYFLSVWLRGNLFDEKAKAGSFSIQKFLHYAFPVLIQALAFTAFFTVDVLLAKHFLPAFEAGIYAALSTLGKVIYFAAQPITAAMFPIVIGKKSRGEAYRGIFFVSFLLTVLISILAVSLYWLFPSLAIGILYGKDYLTAAPSLVWMGLFIGVYTANYILVNFLLSIERTKIVYLPLAIAVIQVVGINIWHSGIMDIITVSLVSMLILFVGLSLYMIYTQIPKLYVKN
ncbi:MAG: Capsular polysaccharide biosynthesis protein [Candidatus Woesebacteria bacterium GW2011_GWA1_39_12]|uniref:Capsular polysaccharide biosynthesis protein n=1 Tax=Candidatus Woesebacteria bacterium GW2011_GWA1_39_12 TaxID=1618549 RepID=A0A0G0LZK4_9BACT|nr:MAG: Capsular polysaccharide biosynthesis protein [Candidatus Woesebacteria bacterium GW2011_GWA1_39_12]